MSKHKSSYLFIYVLLESTVCLSMRGLLVRGIEVRRDRRCTRRVRNINNMSITGMCTGHPVFKFISGSYHLLARWRH